jgi:hypothetical protein
MVRNVLFLLFFPLICAHSAPTLNSYSKITEDVMVTPASAAMAGADLSISSGASSESTPGNLPFDSLNHLSLSYAGFFHNTFSNSVLAWNSHPRKNLGVSVMAGYLYIPDIPDTRASLSNEAGELIEARISTYSASKFFFRAGIGQRFDVTPGIALGVGVAVNAKRSRLPETGYGIGLDAGLKALFIKTGISLALQLENITSSYTYWNESYQERANPHLRAGAGWGWSVPYLYGTIKVAYATPDLFANEGINDISTETTSNNTTIETPGHAELYEKPSLLFTQGSLGVEYAIFKTVIFRLGVTNGKFGFGAGLRMFGERAGLDFAYIAHSLAETYQVSAQYAW